LPGTAPPEPVRRTGHSPQVVPAPHGLAVAVAATVVRELAAVASTDGGQDGSLAVLVPSELVALVRAALEAEGIGFGQVGAGAIDAQVSLLEMADAKGLEFDAVVVVEPARIVASGPHGMRALYVALTRCTRRLAIVHQEPLPAPLRSASLPSAEVPDGS
jgi:superfamily I DNA/RNA helicase